jgi:succinyl-CoA synthetase alpha subunit
MFQRISSIFYCDESHLEKAWIEKNNLHLKALVIPSANIKTFCNFPVFKTVKEAKKHTQCNAALILVDKDKALDASLECIHEHLEWIVLGTGKLPQEDLLHLKEALKTSTTKILGPGSCGFCIPKELSFGTWHHPFAKGEVALLSKSETLLYMVAEQLKGKGLGLSFAMHIGNEALYGLGFKEGLQYAQEDGITKAVIMISDACINELECVAQMKKAPFPLIFLMAGISHPEIKDVDAHMLKEKIEAIQSTPAYFAKNFLELGKKCKEVLA